MTNKDVLKTVITNIIRNKKNLFNFIIMTICSIVTIIIIFFGYNFLNIFNNDMKKQIRYRTFHITPNITPEILANPLKEERTKTINELRERAIKELETLDHIQIITKTEYNEFHAETSDFKEDGRVTFLYGTEKSLPTIVEGRAFKDGESGVAVCPVKFLPDPLENKNLGLLGIPIIKQEDLLSNKDLLETTFMATYDEYELKGQGAIEVVGSYSKKFKIIGLYNNVRSSGANNSCYIPSNDLIEMCHQANLVCAESQEHIDLTVVVDNVKNIAYFLKAVANLGLSFRPEAIQQESLALVHIVETAFFVLIVLILGVVVVITSSYVKKKVLHESEIIGILRTCGYCKKTIKKIYLLENIIINIMAYLLAFFLFLIIMFNLKKRYMMGLIYRGIHFKFKISLIFYSFSLIVFLSMLIAYISFSKKLKLKITFLLKGGE